MLLEGSCIIFLHSNQVFISTMLCMLKASEADGFTAIFCSVLAMLQRLDQIFQLYCKQNFPVSLLPLCLLPHKRPDLQESLGKSDAVSL